ncbi:MAG: ABC transporter ATP-binding protein [Planctomycetes bacterium SM23_32]|nr:MAG: ABC transporter ATP-binding protein [Planctomycetes bacterium SM23_32]
MAAAIQVHGLTRRFGDLVAVDHVGFSVSEGEVFGFLGPNGAGKTTTVRMLTGVLDPTEGTATIQGHDICAEPLAAREHLGIVPEEANVYLDLSVWRNVMLMAELHGVPRCRRVEEGERLLGLLGLGERRKQKARGLSKGLRQRLMLCSALVSGPELLFLDEPTSGLDVQSARLIRQVVRDLNGHGLTVFLTTHNMAEAEEMCDRVAIINEGRIAAIDTPDQLRQTVRASQYVEVSFEGPGPQEAALRGLPEVERLARQGERMLLYTRRPGRTAVALADLADREGLEVRELRTCTPSLEDVFLFLTRGGGGEKAP